MKRITETFTEEEFIFLKEVKSNLSWHDFILSMAEKTKNTTNHDTKLTKPTHKTNK